MDVQPSTRGLFTTKSWSSWVFEDCLGWTSSRPIAPLILTPSRIRKSLVYSSGTAEGLFRLSFSDTWGFGHAFEWYRRQQSHDTRKIQLMKEESTFSHEYILATLQSGKTVRFERSPDPKAHPDAMVHTSGCEAYDTIDTDSEDLRRADEHVCLGEIVFKDGFDLLFVISTCFAMSNDEKARRYTSQEYNCYFFARTIFTLTIRYTLLLAPRRTNWSNRTIRWDMVPDSLPDLGVIVNNHPGCTSAQSFLYLKESMTRIVASAEANILKFWKIDSGDAGRSRAEYIPHTWGEIVTRSIYEVITAVACELTLTSLQDMLWGETVLDKLGYGMTFTTSPTTSDLAATTPSFPPKELLSNAFPALMKILRYLLSRRCALQDMIASGQVTLAQMENAVMGVSAKGRGRFLLADALFQHINDVYSDIIPSALSAWLLPERDCFPPSLEVRVVSNVEQKKAAKARTPPTLSRVHSHIDFQVHVQDAFKLHGDRVASFGLGDSETIQKNVFEGMERVWKVARKDDFFAASERAQVIVSIRPALPP
ncbi:hypothetical protein JAAARDRAFT_189476 [Jaapia argillacea MUCL 33604]|uniref:Uncharacterized protein n=1 Tax=Jaapia argillacea MUCL 33604 TaxID=933084 RepID=A0A067Q4X1_9AGAM|nr:hypothetical protein JAAARDRAFT_189476 [Jaapia argillacea MUCL 33604]